MFRNQYFNNGIETDHTQLDLFKLILFVRSSHVKRDVVSVISLSQNVLENYYILQLVLYEIGYYPA